VGRECEFAGGDIFHHALTAVNREPLARGKSLSCLMAICLFDATNQLALFELLEGE
jgi:hypothetical protein